MTNPVDPTKVKDHFWGNEPPPPAANDMITLSPEAAKLSRIARETFWGPITNERPTKLPKKDLTQKPNV